MLLIMIVLVAFMVPGYIMRKRKLLSDGSSVTLSNILLYVCQPFLMMRAFAITSVTPAYSTLVYILWSVLLSLISMFFTFGLSRLAFLKEKNLKRKNVYTFAAMFSNCGFIGIPFIDMLTDGDSVSILFIGVYNMAFNILIWTFGVYFMTGDKKNINIKKAFLNPAMIGSYIGLLLMYIPQINIFKFSGFTILAEIPECFSYMTSVLSMFIVGIRLADMPIKTIFTDKYSYISAALRLIATPVFTFILMVLFDQFVLPVYVMGMWLAVVVASAMTPASSVVAYAEAFDGDKEAAARSFVLGTLLGIVTIPLMISLIYMYYC